MHAALQLILFNDESSSFAYATRIGYHSLNKRNIKRNNGFEQKEVKSWNHSKKNTKKVKDTDKQIQVNKSTLQWDERLLMKWSTQPEEK